MMEIMTKEESYAERRLLFKNIWDTAMQMDEKDVDNIMNKPKVIKTLRLDQVDRYVIGKGKKERIKNLRAVCKKILNFCDRQDADDMIYEQVLQKTEKKETEEGEEQPQHKLDVTHKKLKKYHRRKKLKKSSGHQATTTGRKNNYPRIFANSSGKNKPGKTKSIAFNFVKRTSITHKRAKRFKSDPDAEVAPARESAARRKIKRKKRSKRKKRTLPNLSRPGPSGASDGNRFLSSHTVTGRVIVKRIRQILTDNEIAVVEPTLSTT